MTTTLNRLRYLTFSVAVAATLPYLGLKIAWLVGSDIGLYTLSNEASATLDSLNIFTAGLDAVAILVAAVFPFSWGRRVPAWLILIPSWLGTGLLAQVAITAAMQPVVAGITGRKLLPDASVQVEQLPVAPWVFSVVYIGFAVLGLALITGFVAYATGRWPSALRRRPSAVPSLAAVTRPAAGLTAVAAVAAVVLAALYLLWACGSQFGLSADNLATRSIGSQVTDFGFALFLVAGAVGLVLLSRNSRVPQGIAVALAWLGSGGSFGSGMWMTLVRVLGGEGAAAGDLASVATFAECLVGLALGAVLLMIAAQRGFASSIHHGTGAPVESGRRVAV